MATAAATNTYVNRWSITVLLRGTTSNARGEGSAQPIVSAAHLAAGAGPEKHLAGDDLQITGWSGNPATLRFRARSPRRAFRPKPPRRECDRITPCSFVRPRPRARRRAQPTA